MKTNNRFICSGIAGSLLALTLALPTAALAWGDLGHQVVAEIALRHLNPTARSRVEQLLASDPDTLTAHDMVSSSVWADRFRDSSINGPKVNYHHTHEWHFVDLDRTHPSLPLACNGHTPLPAGAAASEGPAHDCVVDKIEQFAAELRASPASADAGASAGAYGGTDAKTVNEERVALKFLIHLVGDLHQPLHAIDDHDRGGNEKRVRAAGLRANSLHHYWDTTLVEQLGSDPKFIAEMLDARITLAQLKTWQQGTPRTWARESYETARTYGYDALPTPDERGRYTLSAQYIHQGTRVVALQLEAAGVRLALLLNQSLK
jgi:S1/P1 Nuclease